MGTSIGDNDKYCLRWNDYSSNMSLSFRDLRKDCDFFDVTLVTDEDHIRAHKLILSACSPRFRVMLKRLSQLENNQKEVIYLRGVRHCDLVAVVEFMYHGEVNVAHDQLNSFLAVAEDLKVKGLTQNSHVKEPQSKRQKMMDKDVVEQNDKQDVYQDDDQQPLAAVVATNEQANNSTTNEEAVTNRGYQEEEELSGIMTMENGAMCMTCGKSFSNYYAACRHFREKHEEEADQNTILHCDYCEKTFKIKRYRQIHTKMVHGISSKTVQQRPPPIIKNTRQSRSSNVDLGPMAQLERMIDTPLDIKPQLP